MGTIELPVPEGRDEAQLLNLISRAVERFLLDEVGASLREAEAALDGRELDEEDRALLSDTDREALFDFLRAALPSEPDVGWSDQDEWEREFAARDHDISERIKRNPDDVDAWRDRLELMKEQEARLDGEDEDAE